MWQHHKPTKKKFDEHFNEKFITMYLQNLQHQNQFKSIKLLVTYNFQYFSDDCETIYLFKILFLSLKRHTKWFSAFNCEISFSLSFQEVGDFQIDDKLYRKLGGNARHDYNYWSRKCEGLMILVIYVCCSISVLFILLIIYSLHYFLVSKKYFKMFLELGKDWTPAIIESQKKLQQIRSNINQLTDQRVFWVGGSTNARPNNAAGIQFHKYRVDERGRWQQKCLLGY